MNLIIRLFYKNLLFSLLISLLTTFNLIACEEQNEKDKPVTSSNIMSLPNEMQLEIFKNLDRKSLVKVSIVCKAWHQIANDDNLLAHVIFTQSPVYRKYGSQLTDDEIALSRRYNYNLYNFFIALYKFSITSVEEMKLYENVNLIPGFDKVFMQTLNYPYICTFKDRHERMKILCSNDLIDINGCIAYGSNGFDCNPKLAVKLNDELADLGFEPAQHRRVQGYAEGHYGYFQNRAYARELNEELIEKGNIEAFLNKMTNFYSTFPDDICNCDYDQNDAEFFNYFCTPYENEEIQQHQSRFLSIKQSIYDDRFSDEQINVLFTNNPHLKRDWNIIEYFNEDTNDNTVCNKLNDIDIKCELHGLYDCLIGIYVKPDDFTQGIKDARNFARHHNIHIFEPVLPYTVMQRLREKNATVLRVTSANLRTVTIGNRTNVSLSNSLTLLKNALAQQGIMCNATTIEGVVLYLNNL